MTENLPAILRQLATDPAYLGGTANAQFLLLAAQKLEQPEKLAEELSAHVRQIMRLDEQEQENRAKAFAYDFLTDAIRAALIEVPERADFFRLKLAVDRTHKALNDAGRRYAEVRKLTSSTEGDSSE